MDSIQKWKRMGFFYGIILAAAGALLFFFPEKIINMIGLILGIFMIAAAGLKGITLMRTWNEGGVLRVFSLIVSLIFLFFGIFLLINRSVAVAVISVLIGIFALLSAADRFAVAKNRKQLGLSVSSTVVSGIVHLLFGIGMVAMPLYGASLIMMVTGAYLIAAGVMIVLSSCIFMDL